MGESSFTRPPGPRRFGEPSKFDRSRRPGRTGYFVATAILVASVGAFVPLLLRAIRTIADARMHRMVAPGSAEFTLSEPGRYTIFHEHRSVHEGRTYSGGDVSGLKITMVRADDGSEIPLEAGGVNTTYSYGNRAGRSLMTFTLERPGPVVLTAEPFASALPGVEIVLAVGQIDIAAFVFRLLTAIGVAVGGVLLAIGLFVVTLLRRSRAESRDRGLDSGPGGR